MPFPFYMVIFFALATLAVLLVGVILMMKGGEANKKYSGKLMSLRVALQALTLASLALLYLMRK